MMEKTGRLGFGGWLKFLFRTVLYSVLLFIIASVAMVSSENPSVKDGFPTISLTCSDQRHPGQRLQWYAHRL